MATSGSPAEEDMSHPVTAEAGSRRLVVLVNGLPAAGKTTLARALSRRLSLSLFSKDVIKEAHAGIFGAQPPDGRPQRWALATPLPIPDTLHVDTTGHVDLDAVAGWCRHPRWEVSGPQGGHTRMHARLGAARQAWATRPRGPSVAVRETADGAHRPS